MKPVRILFCDARSADFSVAGLACVTRSILRLREVGAIDEMQPCEIVLRHGPQELGRAARSQIERLVPGLQWNSCKWGEAGPQDENGLYIGEQIVLSDSDPQLMPRNAALQWIEEHCTGAPRARLRRSMNHKSRAIIAATGKPGDGVVSRYLNRPISRLMTRALLRLGNVRPVHATIATAGIGLAMFGALVFAGEAGLIAGALLFQLASIVDGVDGEIARATHSSSKFGASLDTAIDAATNLAFLIGLAVNLFIAGERAAVLLGAAGIGVLALGLFVLGLHALRNGEPLNFDALKAPVRASKSRLLHMVGALASRDFYAFVFMLLVLAGMARLALMIFALACIIWFAVVVAMLSASGGRKGTNSLGS